MKEGSESVSRSYGGASTASFASSDRDRAGVRSSGRGNGNGNGGYEMDEMNRSHSGVAAATNGRGNGRSSGAGTNGPSTMAEFFDEIESIRNATRRIDENINRIEQLHAQTFQQIGDDRSDNTRRQLDALTAETRSMQTQVRNAIKLLEGQYMRMDPSSSERKNRRQQTENVKRRFMEQLRRLMQIEQSYQQKSRARARRQMEIANPDASEQDIEDALDSDQAGQVFANAVLRSNRSGEARVALREVQARHSEIKKIEKSITELAELMRDMAIITEAQAPDVEKIEQGAIEVHKDLEEGNRHIDKAITSARAARKKKWFCLLVILLIIGLIALVIVLVKVLK